MIGTYNMLSCNYNIAAVPNLTTSTILTTRGNDLKLQKKLVQDMRKFCFTNIVVNMWNSLPNGVVHEESTNVFKTRLGKF